MKGHEHDVHECASELHTTGFGIGRKKRRRAGQTAWERLLPDSEKEPLVDIHEQMVLDERLPGYKGVYAKYGQVEINRPPISKQLCPELVPAMAYKGKLNFKNHWSAQQSQLGGVPDDELHDH